MRCKRLVGPRVPQHHIIIEVRRVEFPRRAKVHTRIESDGKRKPVDDPGGEGDQIAREITVCPKCSEAEPGEPSH
jgi:hypothetical protein